VTRTATSFEGVAVPFAALEGVPLLAGLGPSELVAVAASMRFRDFPAGAVVAREGEPGGTMLVIVDGLANELASMAEGPEARSRSVFAEGRLVGKLRRGDVVGAIPLVTGEPHATTVRTAVATSALELGGDEFGELMARFPAIVANLSRILSDRLAAATRHQARRGARGEAVALIAAPSLAGAVPEILAAARAASPGPLETVDGDHSLDAALSRLDDLLLDHRTVVLAAGLARDTLPLLLEQVDRAVVLVGEGEGDDLPGPATASAPIEIVLATDAAGGRRREGVVRLVKPVDGAPGLPPADVAWLGRHLARTKLGLALGAGGAKGYAHVGALHVLEEAGYTIDYVGGSSIGAIVGACVALGMSASEVDTTLREAFTPDTVAEVFKLSLSGQSTGRETMRRILDETTSGRSFEDTTIPFVAMAVDLTDRVPAPLREGPLWQALMASTALAGMFPPLELDGHRLVDGLALVPVPVAAVADDGADVMVSVNIMSRETLPAWPGQAEPEPEPERRGSRMLETLLEVMDVSQLDTSISHAARADVVVTPRFGPSSWRDFELADLFLAAGRQAAEEQLPVLQSLARPQAAVTT
jgi:predicted acylesterase/phospholipase RssA/CRP-like cAMP-binding protein